VIDVADAGPGRWQVLAMVESAPYRAFPAVVVVGVPTAAASASTKMNPGLVETAGNVRFERISVNAPAAVKRARPLRITVTKPKFDDMGRLLKQLGQGYRYTEIDDRALITPGSLDPYDILFLTCGGFPGEWGAPTTGGEAHPGVVYGEMRPDLVEKLKQTLGRFLERGGTIYASDLRQSILDYAFPDRIPEKEFDLERLRSIDDIEMRWLKTVVPAAKVDTVGQTVDKLKLSAELGARRDELVAALSTSVVCEIDQKAGDPDDLTAVRRLIKRRSLPATEADCTAIAAEFERRRSVIKQARAARSQTKLRNVRGEINRIESTLKEFRDRLDLKFEGVGGQYVDAQVVDSGLNEAIGPTIRLQFPKNNEWRPGRFAGDGQVLIRGTYVTIGRQRVDAPLLVRFRQGLGTIIFTCFHNEAQNSQQELELLRYLVFSATTAKEEALAQQTMLAGGFSPVKQGQVNHAMGADSITRKYQSESGDPLRFALNFGGNGAVLRLTLIAPGGAKFEEDTGQTMVVEARGAPAGEWLYTVTAVKVPYQNFAYSVSIGKGAGGSP
jgi:hypothetical protein